MPRNVDLMGLGLPGPTSNQLGITPISVTGVGATQGAATTFYGGSHLALFTAATTTACGMVFAANSAVGTPNYIVMLSTTSVTGTVYCPASGTMNGTTNGSVVLTTGKTCVIIQTSATSAGGNGGTWVSFPLTP